MAAASKTRGRLTPQLISAVRLSPVRGYILARSIGLHPTQLSMWLNDARDIRLDDERVRALGRLVGVAPDDCVEQAPASTRATADQAAQQ